jgi:hypothetical protein
VGFEGSELLMTRHDNAIPPAFRHPPHDLRFDNPDGALSKSIRQPRFFSSRTEVGQPSTLQVSQASRLPGSKVGSSTAGKARPHTAAVRSTRTHWQRNGNALAGDSNREAASFLLLKGYLPTQTELDSFHPRAPVTTSDSTSTSKT